MAGGYGPLYFVNEAGDCVDGVVFGSRPKLGHGEEVVLFDVGVDAFGGNFFEELASAFEEGNWSVGFGDGVVWLLWFVDHDDGCGFPGVVSCA